MNNESVSVIVRTMPGREAFLDKCLFHLRAQEYQALNVVVVAQALRDEEEAEPLRKVVSEWAASIGDVRCIVHVSAQDARSRSLNLGIRAATGRYLSLLDDDDKVYPNHYSELIQHLRRKEAAWAYSDVIRAVYNEHGQLVSRSGPYRRPGYSYLDHLRANYLPIHSFVIDRLKVTDVGDFDERLIRLEDWDFLIRLGMRHKPAYLPRFTAEYCIRADGSNSVVDGTDDEAKIEQKNLIWRAAELVVADNKRATFGWWIDELAKLPMMYPNRNDTYASASFREEHESRKKDDFYQRYLSALYASRSWRLTAPIRKVGRWIRGVRGEADYVPADEAAASLEVQKVLSSTSWEVMAPVRLFTKVVRALFRAR